MFGKKKKYRVRAFICNDIHGGKDHTWSTHVNKDFDTFEKAKEEHDKIYLEWKEWIDNSKFNLESIWEH